MSHSVVVMSLRAKRMVMLYCVLCDEETKARQSALWLLCNHLFSAKKCREFNRCVRGVVVLNGIGVGETRLFKTPTNTKNDFVKIALHWKHFRAQKNS